MNSLYALSKEAALMYKRIIVPARSTAYVKSLYALSKEVRL